jgi:hypothetical protein
MKSRPFKILGPELAAGIASVVGHRLPWFPQAIAEVHRKQRSLFGTTKVQYTRRTSSRTLG